MNSYSNSQFAAKSFRSAGTVGLLLSGGLDSSILLAHFLTQGFAVQPFYIRTGTIWQSAEFTHIRKLLRYFRENASTFAPCIAPLVEFELPLADLYGPHWSTTGQNTPSAATPDEAVFLPGRNALLLIKPALWCQLHDLKQLALAPLSGNPFDDATPEFFTHFQELLARSGKQAVEIVRPFESLTKREVLRLVPGFPYEHTFSCIAPQAGIHCGRCNKCAERGSAFLLAELPDPTDYAIPPVQNTVHQPPPVPH